MRGEQRASTDRWHHHDSDDDRDANEDASYAYSDHSGRSDDGSRHYEEHSCSGASLSADALIAHRQVLEMAATIETLTRDFENQQQELLRAYKQLNEYARMQREDEAESDMSGAQLFRRDCSRSRSDGEDAGKCSMRGGRCSHFDDLNELQKLVDVKDSALTEALQQRNEYRVELERAEVLIRELRAAHSDGSDSSRAAWKVHPTASTMGIYHATGVAMPCTQVSLAPSFVSLGAGASDVPRHERFDNESAYQRRENDELYWRKQYKEAVRMRKKFGLVNPAAAAAAGSGPRYAPHASSSGAATRPSLKIFSFPDNRREKGIKDENVPFSRYIGISARQHEIIKEQHRMLA